VSARRDIIEILEYTLQTWDEEQSDAYAADLDAGIATLASYPNLGSEVSPKQPGLRRFKVREHLILYRVESDELIVLRVVHPRTNLARVIVNE